MQITAALPATSREFLPGGFVFHRACTNVPEQLKNSRSDRMKRRISGPPEPARPKERQRAGGLRLPNPKSEVRNPEEIRNPKPEVAQE